MKVNLLFILSLFWSLAALADTTDPRATFEQANEAYKSGEYEKAIEMYQSLTDEGQSANLYFNLGNSYFKTNDVARAILHYERALKLNPGDPDIEYNLKLANERIKDKIEKLPELNITRWWKTFTLSFGVDAWAWMSALFLLAASALLLLFFVTRTRSIKLFSFYTAIVLILSSSFTYYQASQAKEIIEADTQAIILSPRVDVKGGPTNSGVNVFVIHEGTKVKVLGEQEGWVNIRIASGNEGWIQESDCAII